MSELSWTRLRCFTKIITDELLNLRLGIQFFLTCNDFLLWILVFLVSPLVNRHGDKDPATADEDVEDDPDDHLGYLSLREELQAELQYENQFTKADHDKDPAPNK